MPGEEKIKGSIQQAPVIGATRSLAGPDKSRLISVSKQKESAATAQTAPFDILASAYDAWFEDDGKTIFDIEVKAFQNVLPSLPKPWLEVGVGSGRFAQALGIDTGIDPSIKLLEMARDRGIAGFIARGEDSYFAEEAFGTVFLIVTLCFVDSPLDVLKQAHRILIPEGKIVLGLVLRDNPWGQFYLAKKEEGHRFYRYAKFYSYRQVTDLLGQTDFSIEKVTSTLFQRPDEIKQRTEPVLSGYYADAGFTVIVAGKISAGK